MVTLAATIQLLLVLRFLELISERSSPRASLRLGAGRSGDGLNPLLPDDGQKPKRWPAGTLDASLPVRDQVSADIVLYHKVNGVTRATIQAFVSAPAG